MAWDKEGQVDRGRSCRSCDPGTELGFLSSFVMGSHQRGLNK